MHLECQYLGLLPVDINWQAYTVLPVWLSGSLRYAFEADQIVILIHLIAWQE